MFPRVVIAIDLSEASDQIVVNLKGLMQLGTREVVLAHAMDIAPQSISGPGFDYNETLRGDLSRRVQARLDKLRDAVEAQGFQASARIVYGAPSAAIESVARQTGASLVIVGSRGSSLARNIVLGSCAVEILNHSQMPILLKRLIRNETTHHSKYSLVCSNFAHHLLFSTDFSTTANHAFQFLERIVATRGSQVTLLHVATNGDATALKKAEVRLAEAARFLHTIGASKVSVKLSAGNAADHIVEAAETDGVSLVLLGARGNGSVSMEHPSIGHTSQAVARNARVPVLLVPHARFPFTKSTQKSAAGNLFGSSPKRDLNVRSSKRTPHPS